MKKTSFLDKNANLICGSVMAFYTFAFCTACAFVSKEIQSDIEHKQIKEDVEQILNTPDLTTGLVFRVQV